MSKKLILLFAFAAFNHFNSQEKAEQALKTFEEKYPQEKIHLLFNKNNFVAGENLWFKSFVFEGYNPSTISTSLFIELYDSNKKQISKKIIPLLNGEGSGSIALPASLKEDIYYIRAYTTWMANFSEDFQLVKPIAIYNPSSPQKLIIDNTSMWNAAAYPEGGTFIDGISTKFAVRLQSKGVLPSNWNGSVVDIENPGINITTFKGLDQNVGSFSMIPKAGKKYQLIIQDDKAQKQNIDLPEVAGSGISMQVTSNPDNIKYTLKYKNLPESASYKVLGTINNQLVYKARINKIANETSYSIPNAQLINGILQLTVFDDKENVVAQRLSFVQPQLLQIKQPSLQNLSINNAPRGKNSFTITKDPNYSDYTILVLDSNAESSEDEQNLLSSLWLTGDITSKIVNPSQYFIKNRNVDALDALLISEKWKRFEWKSIMSGTYPIIKYNPVSYLSYKGKVNIKGQPAPNTDLNLLFDKGSGGTNFFQVKTDNNGFFVLNNLLFEDTMKFSYQLNSDQKELKNESSVFFQPNFEFIPYRKSLPMSQFKLADRTAQDPIPAEVSRSVSTINNQKFINEKVHMIEEVKIKGERKNSTKKLNSELSSALFRSANEEVFDFVNNPQAMGSTNVLQWLQGRVAGLQLQLKNGTYTPTLRGDNINLYLDEMQSDANQISGISISDIAMVKVIKGAFAGNFGGGTGAIVIYTRRGGGATTDTSKPSLLRQISLTGYDKEDPFTSPMYDEESFKGITNDTRTTLYWNPYLQVESDKSTNVEFFNNDDAKSYKVIIVGYDRNNDVPLYYDEILK
ncbi:hypothetical protein SAMN05421664_3304 [Chryseobacterium soldanellicola]|uniref:TonB-dependent Receptor Plug Domain n=1 Tax=Chryseobacterium soldanellicola TaxID=311333 RepID=A0A1H1FWI1_9FLAO|nr:hypothetical protein [Chryseobacterium soldanellicola]SDR05260.1 hypothetical protein SAMN05421664_3304 [Chryseobacterium soldanellicola]